MVRAWHSRAASRQTGVRAHYQRRYTHHANRTVAARRIQAAWRKRRPQASYTKSVRSVNKPNQSRFRGRNLIQGHKFIGKFNNKMLHGLTGTGILEKRLIRHGSPDYKNPSVIATDNPKLRSMSGYVLQYSNKDQPSVDIAAATGITAGTVMSAFALGTLPSADRYVFYKNFQSEVTITTEASTFAGAPDPTQATQLGYVNQLNFRVLLLKRKPGLAVGNPSGVPFNPQEPTMTNSLYLGYGNNAYGFTRQYGDTASTPNNAVAPIDAMLGKINKGMWQVLQDKQFPLSVPVANVAGAESKYPNMKKLVFSHKINEKVLVSQAALGTEPLDWEHNYMTVILAGIPNSSNATLLPAVGLVPDTTRLWKVTARGFTSYLDA